MVLRSIYKSFVVCHFLNDGTIFQNRRNNSLIVRVLNLQNRIIRVCVRMESDLSIMHTRVVHNRPLLHCWLNRNLKVQICIKSAALLHLGQPHWIANASFFSLHVIYVCACTRVYKFFFFSDSLSFRQSARHLRDGRDDRSMEQSAADVIMNFDAARSSIIIIRPHLNKLFIFVARRSRTN